MRAKELEAAGYGVKKFRVKSALLTKWELGITLPLWTSLFFPLQNGTYPHKDKTNRQTHTHTHAHSLEPDLYLQHLELYHYCWFYLLRMSQEWGILTFSLGYLGKCFIGVQGQSVADHSVLLELLEAWLPLWASEGVEESVWLEEVPSFCL